MWPFYGGEIAAGFYPRRREAGNHMPHACKALRRLTVRGERRLLQCYQRVRCLHDSADLDSTQNISDASDMRMTCGASTKEP
jgi:hypothetical protein